jgi:hypothetical protein
MYTELIQTPPNPTAADVIAVLHHHLTLQYGPPHCIHHDHDTLFQSTLRLYATSNGASLQPHPVRAHTPLAENANSRVRHLLNALSSIT